MYVCTSEIVKKANKIVDLCGTRDPHRIARELGVEINEITKCGGESKILYDRTK